jgi:hypothetical protein
MPRRRAVNDTSRRAALIAAALVAAVLSAGGAPALPAELPNRAGTLKFAVIGDNGTGERPQFEVAEQRATARKSFPYELVIMLGDNFYGSQRPADLARKGEVPTSPFSMRASHSTPRSAITMPPLTVSYTPLDMDGRRYCTFTRNRARFYPARDPHALAAVALMAAALTLAGGLASGGGGSWWARWRAGSASRSRVFAGAALARASC